MRDAWSKLIQFKILNRLYWTPGRKYRGELSLQISAGDAMLNEGTLSICFSSVPAWPPIGRGLQKRLLTAWVWVLV